MERILTALMTGLWMGVLAGFGIAYWIWANPSESNGQVTFAEKGMGEGLAILGGGILGGFIVFAVAVALTYSLAPPDHLRGIQILDAIAILVLCVVGAILTHHSEPRKFVSYTGILEIEVRVPKEMYHRQKLKDALIIGTSSYLPPDLGRYGKVREEGGFVVQNMAMTVPEKHDWNVTVTASTIDQMWFKLPWEAKPAGALPWTEWMAPTEKAGPRSEGIQARCQWRLVASAAEMHVRRFFE